METVSDEISVNGQSILADVGQNFVPVDDVSMLRPCLFDQAPGQAHRFRLARREPRWRGPKKEVSHPVNFTQTIPLESPDSEQNDQSDRQRLYVGAVRLPDWSLLLRPWSADSGSTSFFGHVLIASPELSDFEAATGIAVGPGWVSSFVKVSV